MGDKRLSEVINYDEHIEPYRIIEIVSGVGSGKNYWVENVLMKEKRVLLVTSRKSKVEETKGRTKLSSRLNLNYLEGNALDCLWNDDKTIGCCVCNNWQIEYYMKNIYIKDDEKTHLSKFFDIVVIDEAHSLVSDATYCDAPFYVFQFIKSLYRQSDIKIILTTATYRPIKDLIKSSEREDFAHWDFTEECKRVRPKKLYFYPRELAWCRIAELYNRNSTENRKFVYFATRTDTIKSHIIPFLVRKGVPEKEIAVSFSNEESAEGFSEIVLKNKTRAEAYLKEYEDLPQDIKVFITTSKNKEGINIDNKNYKWDILIESHWDDEVEQMWGRIRSNLNATILIYDAAQHQTKSIEKDFDYYFDKDAKKLINNHFDSWCKKMHIPDANRIQDDNALQKINTLQKERFPYLRYSPVSERFEVYNGRVIGTNLFKNSIEEYDFYVDYLRGYVYVSGDYNLFGIPSYIAEEKCKKERLEEYLNSNGYLERNISKKDKEDILNFITNELNVYKKKSNEPYADLAKAIKQFGYKPIECSKNKNNKAYGNYRLEKHEQKGGDWDIDI